MLLIVSLTTIAILIALILWLLKYSREQSLVLKETQKKNEFMLKARDNLLRSVNHELRAPLTRMKMDVEFISDAETKDSLGKDILFMEHLVEELMEIEKIKIDSSPLQPVGINSILEETVQKLRVDLSLLEFEPGEEHQVLGHSYQLLKLFKNLIENAFKYKDESGKVIIKVGEDAKKINISILNQGEPIPAQDLPYIFEPFFRVDKSRSSKKEGLGLGLNICKEIIDSHNGKIVVTSKKGLGTIFKLSFPKITKS